MQNVGIVGGVGPDAGVDLHKKIITHTKAEQDQDHVPVYHISCPHLIVDRTEFYLGKSQVNPAISIIKIISLLYDLQCYVIGIPCNSTHIPSIRNFIDSTLKNKYADTINVLHMVKEVAIYLHSRKIYTVGLLATKGTYQSKIYQDILGEYGIRVVVPKTDEQIERIHDSIYNTEYGIKSNVSLFLGNQKANNILREESNALMSENIDGIVMGCTEIPLALSQEMVDTPLFDATDILAQALLYKSNPDKLLHR